jgi:hypothetical protein
MILSKNMTQETKDLFISTANILKGSERRAFMAKTVKAMGRGGQILAEQQLGWRRATIRKGTKELESGVTCLSGASFRGRKSTLSKLPNIHDDIRSIVDSQSQTDPQFKNNRLYTKMTASEVRRQLIKQKEYSEEELPSEEIIRQMLNTLGYHLQSVQKSLPKKSPSDGRDFRASSPS